MTESALVVEVQDVSGHASNPSDEEIRRWAALALAGASGELTVRIVDEAESAALNARYRGGSGPTNVLAFASELRPTPSLSDHDPLPLGDLVICASVVAREAREQGKTPAAHWAHIVIHGALHLAGYEHDTEEQALVMEQRERELLAGLGLPDPYA